MRSNPERNATLELLEKLGHTVGHGDRGPHPGPDPYGDFVAGPSTTGDIGGLVVHRAQAARTLPALPPPPAGGTAVGSVPT